MYQIFFDQRSIVICSKTEDYFQEHGTVTLSGEEYSDLSDIPEMFDTSTHISKLYIPSDDPEKTFRKLASHFTEINAAGGAVENPD